MSRNSTLEPISSVPLAPHGIRSSRSIKTLTPKGYLICKKYMLGIPPNIISSEIGCAESYVRLVLSSIPGQEAIENLRKELDQDFLALQAKYNKVIRDAMDHSDASIALTGANLWAKGAGKYNKENQVNIQVNISPVDLSAFRNKES